MTEVWSVAFTDETVSHWMILAMFDSEQKAERWAAQQRVEDLDSEYRVEYWRVR